jgi:hypothetical protein
MRNDRKVAKHLFRAAFSFVSVAVLVITVVISIIESVKSTNRAFLEVFITQAHDIECNHSCTHGFFHLQTQRTDYLFYLINDLMDCVALG